MAHHKALLSTCVIALFALPSSAADRVNAGQWETTISIGGRPMTASACLTQSDVDAINGDAESIAAYVEKVSASAGCKVKNVKIEGDQVSVATVCADGKENVGTTTYHGDSSQSVNSNGAVSTSKRVGACP